MKKLYFVVLPLCGMIFLPGCVPPETSVKTPEIRTSQQRSPQQNRQTLPSPSYSPDTKQPVLFGEVMVQKGEKSNMDEKPQPAYVPSMAYINDRIFEYGRKLERWKELDREALNSDMTREDAEQMVVCFKELQQMLGGYSRLREELMQQSAYSKYDGESGERFAELQKRDITFLESPCGKTLGGLEDKSAGWQEREESADLSQIETLIERYAVNGEYEEVVQSWLQIPEAQRDRVDLKTRVAYGNALMFLHQEEKAARIYQQIVDELSSSKRQSFDLIALRKVLADLYTAAGNYDFAEQQYKNISDDYKNLGKIDEWSKLQMFILERSEQGSPELTEYSSLLRNYLGFIPEQDGYKVVWQADNFLKNYPYTTVSSNVDMIKKDALARADSWFNGFVSGVEQLAQENKYEEGLELIKTIPNDIIDEEKKLALQAKEEDLVLEDAVNRETQRLVQMKELERQWNSAILLTKSGDYESAIGVFIGLLDTEYSAKASEKIESVSLLAAKAERRRAANIFSRFTKTPDVESKKALLIECRNILHEILVKYPDVDIADKVVGNIERVEREMNMLDPDLLPRLQRMEAEEKDVEPDVMAPLAQDPFEMAEPLQEKNLEEAPYIQ